MKKLLLILLCVPLIGFGQQTYVPDDNFEQALIDLGYDNILDNYVTTDSIYSIESLRLFDNNISDLTGIEDFILLTQLECSFNPITELDISKNINLTDLVVRGCDKLKALDISQNISLTELHCIINRLTNLDVSNNINLNILHCYQNQLTILDVSQNTALIDLACRDNHLISLDLRNGNYKNSKLKYKNIDFDLRGNPNLTCINVDNVSWSNINLINIDSQHYFKKNCH